MSENTMSENPRPIADDDEVEGHKKAAYGADAETSENEDVEGHKKAAYGADAEAPEGDDVEGHKISGSDK